MHNTIGTVGSGLSATESIKKGEDTLDVKKDPNVVVDNKGKQTADRHCFVNKTG